MADLIARTRTLIGDPASATQAFDDQTIQDWLDETRLDVRYEVLTPKPTYTPGGIQWNDYYSAYQHWEQGETLLWTNFTTLTASPTPTSTDRIIGHWGFANQLPAVLLAGQNYDVWLTAANLLEIRATQLSFTTYDFTAAGQTFRRGTIIATLQKQAALYRARARVETARLVRSDVVSAAGAQREAQVGPVSAGVPFITGP